MMWPYWDEVSNRKVLTTIFGGAATLFVTGIATSSTPVAALACWIGGFLLACLGCWGVVMAWRPWSFKRLRATVRHMLPVQLAHEFITAQDITADELLVGQAGWTSQDGLLQATPGLVQRLPLATRPVGMQPVLVVRIEGNRWKAFAFVAWRAAGGDTTIPALQGLEFQAELGLARFDRTLLAS
ncbi:MAG TPA: hypothetical protein VFO38_06385 [Candidatus Saccharimonadales bacterium]|nr:hypothetical protein [Candidatus Saccharimonadales bacterium]